MQGISNEWGQGILGGRWGKKIVVVYDFEHMTPAALYKFGDIVMVHIDDDFKIDFGSIIQELKTMPGAK